MAIEWNKISLQINDDLCHQIFTVLETESNNVVQAGLEFWSFCLRLLSAGITLIQLPCHQFKRQWLSSKITTYNRNVNIKNVKYGALGFLVYAAFCICCDWGVKYTMVSLLELVDKIYGENILIGLERQRDGLVVKSTCSYRGSRLLFPAPSGWLTTFILILPF